MEKILDEVIDGGFDQVLFQIDNESGIGDETLEPDPYWARFARKYAKSKGIEHEMYEKWGQAPSDFSHFPRVPRQFRSRSQSPFLRLPFSV